MLAASVSAGDEIGAEWMADALISWWSNREFELDEAFHAAYRGDFANFSLANDGIDDPLVKELIELYEPDIAHRQDALWGAAIGNYWRDVCYLSLATFVEWGASSPSDDNLALRVVGRFLRKERRDIQARDATHIDFTPDELIFAFVRQNHVRGGYHRGYRADFEQFLRRVQGVLPRGWVSGRVYSSGLGPNDTLDLLPGFTLLLASTVRAEQSFSKKLVDAVLQFVRCDDDAGRSLIDDIEKMEGLSSFMEQPRTNDAYASMTKDVDSALPLSDSWALLASLLADLKNTLKCYRRDRLDALPISETILNEIAAAASGKAFDGRTAIFPVAGFGSCELTNDLLEEHSVNISEFNKGQFTVPLMDTPISRNDDWFGNTLEEVLAQEVLKKLLEQSDVETVEARSPETYWQRFNEIVRTNDGHEHFLLFLESRAKPPWITKWRNPHNKGEAKKPEGLDISRLEGTPYDMKFNETPVYLRAPTAGASILIRSDVLRGIRFTRYENALPVKCVASEHENGKVDLSFKYAFELDLAPAPVFLLRYEESPI